MPGEQTNEERAPGMPMWMWMRMRMSRRMDGRNVGGARNGKGWQSSTRGRPSPSRFPGMDGMDAVQATCKVSTCPSCSGLPRGHRALEAPSANQPPPPPVPVARCTVPVGLPCRCIILGEPKLAPSDVRRSFVLRTSSFGLLSSFRPRQARAAACFLRYGV